MIAIVSSTVRERAAFLAVCSARNWSAVECDSVLAFRRLLVRGEPTVVLTRSKLPDGYSDDVLKALALQQLPRIVRSIVLAGAGTSSIEEARQISLGADCVMRDPVRTEVLNEYLAKYLAESSRCRSPGKTAVDRTLDFAGARLNPLERKLHCGDRFVSLTPRELALAHILAEADGAVVTYDVMFEEILKRPFRGDTSNMRVLLGKLIASAAKVGIPLRPWIGVIPKTGYRLCAPLSGTRKSVRRRERAA